MQKLRNKISDTLIEMGLNPTLKGFTYILEALMYMHENNVDLTKIRTRDLYGRVAEKLDVDPGAVKHSIRYTNNRINRHAPKTIELLGDRHKPVKYTLQLLYLRIK